MPDGAPSCFRGAPGKSGIAKTPPQKLVTSTYAAKLGAQCRVITVTWTKTALGHALSVAVNEASCKVDMRPWCFWRRQGSRRLHVDGSLHVDVLWDLRSATFASTPEPREKYYVAVVYGEEVVLLLGDMAAAAYRRSRAKPAEAEAEAALLQRKEHVFGDTYFRARFGAGGRSHEVGIECQTEGPTDPVLFISVDREPVMEVKRLVWKFRGNDTIHVEGVPVEVFWDVHDWLFSPPGLGHAMFVFKLPDGMQKSVSCKDPYWKRRFPSDFCLLLYAWKSD